MTDINLAPSPRISFGLANSVGFAVLLATIAMAAVVFWPGITTLASEWMTPEYSHGPLIPVFTAVLCLKALRDNPPDGAPARILWPGLLLVVLGLFLGIIGTLGQIGDVVAYGVALFVAGMVLAALGWGRARRLVPPLALLIFMLPLPQLIYWKLTLLLQVIASELGVFFIALAGVPVFLEGNVIDLGVYQLQVAEACSGLQYLIPVVAIACLMSVLYRGPGWHRAVLILAAAPVTVVLNALRIGLVGVAVDNYGIEAAEGVLHTMQGWVMLLSCVSALVVLLLVLRLFQRPANRARPMLDLDVGGIGTVAARATRLPITSTLLAALALTALTAVFLQVTPGPRTDAPARSAFALFPPTIAGSEGLRRALTPEIQEVLAADDYLDMTFISPDQSTAPVNVFASYYRDQTDGSGLHSPEVCLPANGWEVATFNEYTLDLPDTPYGTFAVNRAVIRKGFEQQLVYYWFEGRGARETNDITAKLKVLRDSLSMGRSDGALVRFVTPISDPNNLAVEDARLTEFVRQTLQYLPEFVPL